MSSGRVGTWLLALADAGGVRHPLPRALLRGSDLKPLREAAARHGVLAAVTGNLRQAVRQFGPERVVVAQPDRRRAREALEDFFTAARERLVGQTAFSLLVRRQHDEIGAALARAGAPAVVLKGPAFADRLYPEPALRHFTDIDLLTPKRSVADVERVLEGLGYRRAKEPPRKYAAGYAENAWRLEETPAGTVEVHWDLTNSPSLRRRVSVTYDDLEIESSAAPNDALPELSSSSLLLVAAVHGVVGHRFDRLQVVCDVCQAARGAAGELDDGWLREVTSRTGSAFALAMALAVSGEALREPQCGRVLERLGLAQVGRGWRWLVTPTVVAGSERPLAKLRRQLLREVVKRL